MWKDRTNAVGIRNHPLIRHLGVLDPHHPSMGDDHKLERFSDYCAQILAFERLRLLQEPGERGFDGSRYFKEHFFLLELWKEAFRTQDVLDGTTLYELLSMERRPEDMADSRQQQAKNMVHQLLAQSAVAQFSTGYWQPGMPLSLTSFWAKPGHENDDCRPGTWGGFLRYGSVNWEQTRHHGRCLTPIAIPEEKDTIITAGYLEAAV